MQNFDKIKGLLNRPFPDAKIEGTDIPLFAIRTYKERKKDAYNKDFVAVNKYTGLNAYGYQTIHNGGTESLYRTINSIILLNLHREKEQFFLDLGCGVGRTLYDLAELYSNSRFIGLDYSYNMLFRANEILLKNKLNAVDLSKHGFSSKLIVKTKNLSNVNLIQGSALDIPFNDGSFDCLTNTFLIDRINGSVEKTIHESVRVLKKGGLFLLTDPLNFESPDDWKKFKQKTTIVDLIEKSGIKIKEHFNNLIWRAMKDAAGNYTDWHTLVVWGFKK